jgi:hypothetical protein
MKSGECSVCEEFYSARFGMEDAPLLQCNYCESWFCWRDYMLHECKEGHEPEAFSCMCCGGVKQLEFEKPVLIEGDKFCLKCFTEKPWNNRKKSSNG